MGERVAKRHWGISVDTHTILRWGIVVPVSILLGWLFSMWHVPAAWILAAIIASGANIGANAVIELSLIHI